MENSEVKIAVVGFISLVKQGWPVELALATQHDTVFDELDKESFIGLCEDAVNIQYQMLNN